MKTALLIVIALFALAAAMPAQNVVVDQSFVSPQPETDISFLAQGNDIAQTFTVGVPGILAEIAVHTVSYTHLTLPTKCWV